MKDTAKISIVFTCLIVATLQFGCNRQRQPTASAPSAGAQTAAAKPTGRDGRMTVATAAKDALFTALSGRLMEVMQTEGAVAAISVCSQEAGSISESVGKEYGVQIGRTSFKLRNPANAARDWVQPFVDNRVDTAQQVQLDNGNLGALFPIPLNVKCLMCHGGPDDMLDEVKPELAKRYPQDQATGFKQGDLRGWFWVEVPPDQDAPRATRKTELPQPPSVRTAEGD